MLLANAWPTKASFGPSLTGKVTRRSQNENPEKSKAGDKGVCPEKLGTVHPLRLTWRDLKCVHQSGRGERTILSGVSGRASPGELVALMGPSGAGKSSLLDILSMRKTTGKITGEVSLNDAPMKKKHLRLTAYIPQEDHFMPSLACLETLQFYAGLLLTTSSIEERRARVQHVLEQLDLTEHQQTLVGGTLPGGIRLKGLSGGQKRRLSIAIGLVSSPSVVFMDEPTSGLDSFAAVNVMRFVKDLAQNQHLTIIATLHQPRLDIWRLVSRVSLVSKGLLVYEGVPEQIETWFVSYLGYPYDPIEDGTVAEWCLDLISIDFPKPPDAKRTLRTHADLQHISETFLGVYDVEGGHLAILATREDGASDSLSSHSISLASPKSATASLDSLIDVSTQVSPRAWVIGFWRRFLMLSWRGFAFITRNPADVSGRLFTIAWVAAAVGDVFHSLPDTPESITTRLNVLFMATLVLILFPYLSVSHATADKVFYLSDMSSRLYSPSVYYLSKTLVQLPFQVMNVAAFVLIVYSMTGLRDEPEALLKHLLILTLAYLIFSQILSLAAIVASSEDLTFIIGVCFVAFNLMFSDFFIRKDQMQFSWLGQLSVASPMKYIFEALTQIELRDRDFYTPCAENFEQSYEELSPERQAALPYPKEVISYVLRSMSNENGSCTISGNGLLHLLGHERPLESTLVILCSFLLGMHLATVGLLNLVSNSPIRG